jgi:hypothetical protein
VQRRSPRPPPPAAAAPCLQVVESDVGATIPGVSQPNLRQYALELVRAVADGALHPDKFGVAIKAAGLEASDALAATVADALW